MDTVKGDLEFLKSNYTFLGCKACNTAGQGAPQFCQRERLAYERMDPVSQCLVVCRQGFGFSDLSTVSEKLRLLGTDRIRLVRCNNAFANTLVNLLRRALKYLHW